MGNTDVSDDCLPTLSQLPKLSEVDVRRTRVTVPAAQSVQNAHPRLRIVLNGVKRPNAE